MFELTGSSTTAYVVIETLLLLVFFRFQTLTSAIYGSKEIAQFKGTLMQIWKSPYMFVFIWKQYPENFAFLILRIIELFAREVCIFLKK